MNHQNKAVIVCYLTGEPPEEFEAFRAGASGCSGRRLVGGGGAGRGGGASWRRRRRPANEVERRGRGASTAEECAIISSTAIFRLQSSASLGAAWPTDNIA